MQKAGKQTSRKGTKAWRKNIDMSEINDGIEKRIQEEIEGGQVDQRANQHLFVIDTKGVGEKSKRKDKQLTIDKILAKRSAVPALYARSVEKKSAKSGKERENMSKIQMNLIKRQLNKLSKHGIRRKTNSKDLLNDIWSVADEEKVDEFIEEAIPKKPKAPATLRKKPLVAELTPAVQVAHPGTSYNPSADDHKKAVEEAAAIEMKRLQEENEFKSLNIDKKKIMQQEKASADVTMTVAFESSDEEGDETGEEEEKVAWTPRKKTKKERNKERRLREEQAKLEKEKEERRLLAELNQLNSIERDFEEKQAQRRLKEEKKREFAQVKAKSTAKLSKHAYKALFPTVQLTEELAGSLRELKPEGNLFKELYNNLEKRNIIETRVPVAKRKRYQEKEYEKHSYKKFK